MIVKKFIFANILFIIAICGWYLFFSLKLFPSQLFPAPHNVFLELFNQFMKTGFWIDVGISVYRVSVGFLLAAITGVCIGILMAYYKIIDNIYTPFNNFIRYLPVVTLIPLLMLWVGLGDVEKILVIFIGTFFQLTLMIRDNLNQLDKGYIETAKMLGANKDWLILSKVIIPARLPHILDDLKIGLGWAWSYLLVAEIVAAQKGIGFKIMQANRFLQTSRILAFIFVVGLIGVIFDYLFDLINKMSFKWRTPERLQ